jgi:hypothetical protein
MDPRKRSKIVLLSLIGLPAVAMAAVPLLPQGRETRRNLYPDRAACERDYNPQQCQQSSGTSSGGWHGPYYNGNRSGPEAKADPGPGRSGIARPVQTSLRGGFGAFGRAMHAVS